MKLKIVLQTQWTQTVQYDVINHSWQQQTLHGNPVLVPHFSSSRMATKIRHYCKHETQPNPTHKGSVNLWPNQTHPNLTEPMDRRSQRPTLRVTIGTNGPCVRWRTRLAVTGSLNTVTVLLLKRLHFDIVVVRLSSDLWSLFKALPWNCSWRDVVRRSAYCVHECFICRRMWRTPKLMNSTTAQRQFIYCGDRQVVDK